MLPDSLPDFSAPDTVTSIFTPGRIISLLAAIVAALSVVALVILARPRRDKRGLLAGSVGGLLAGATLLAMPQVMVWATRFRGDM